VTPGVYYVAVDGLTGTRGAAEQARIASAIADLNAEFGQYGVTLVELSGFDAALANVHIRVAASTALGDARDGVLGAADAAGNITLVSGWNWYTGSDASQIGAGQYDFQTIVAHELGHVFGLGESADRASVMYYQLASGEVKSGLSAGDLNQLDLGRGAMPRTAG